MVRWFQADSAPPSSSLFLAFLILPAAQTRPQLLMWAGTLASRAVCLKVEGRGHPPTGWCLWGWPGAEVQTGTLGAAEDW